MNNQELLDAACPLIGDLGAAFYFIPETLGVGKAMGLGGMEFYVQGRAGQMGNTEPEAVAAAFGYFKPALLKSVLDAANAKSDPRVTGTAFMNACATLSRAKLSGLSNLDAFVAVLDKVNNAADGDGLALYAAINTEKLADDAAGRALQLIAILREYRGSAHLVALRAAGLDSKTAHFMKRPDMWKQFGYTEDEAPVITDAITKAREEAERLTDLIVEPAYAVLSDAERTILVDGLKEVKAALAA
ncbi:MAG: hypothetical protein RL114_332 [Actinomycetota bacterium]|jgi:hypothetical protein